MHVSERARGQHPWPAWDRCAHFTCSQLARMTLQHLRKRIVMQVVELSPPVVARAAAAPGASADIGAAAGGSFGRYALHLSGQ
eukprot:365141-Chlamydomonas_euryale.AAC.6